MTAAVYVPREATRVALSYSRAIRAWLSLLEREAIAAVLSPDVIAEGVSQVRARGMDAADPLDRALDRMLGEVERLQPDQEIAREALTHARDTDRFTRGEVERQLSRMAGRPMAAPAVHGGDIVQGFVADNVRLITKMRQSTRDEIEEYVRRGWRSGQDAETIAKTIRNRFRHIKKTRAHLIAADQIGKLQGELTRARLLGAGVTHGRWRTKRDRKVRDAHVALEGRKFDLAVGVPRERFPGWPIRCRCWTEPVLPR